MCIINVIVKQRADLYNHYDTQLNNPGGRKEYEK